MKIKCAYCNKEFEMPECRIKNRHKMFCSKECWNNYKKEQNIAIRCAKCGKEIIINKCRLKRAENICCSQSCRSKFYLSENFVKSSLGKKRTDEHKKIISKTHKGKNVSKETREKHSKTNIEYYKTHNAYWEGKQLSKEVCKKLSESKKKYYAEHPEAIEKIRENRANQIIPIKDTTIEISVQGLLSKLNIEFLKHRTFKSLGIKSAYTYHQVDLYLPKYRLLIECDGDYWHSDKIVKNGKSQVIIDEEQTKDAELAGYKVLRLKEKNIKKDIIGIEIIITGLINE